MNEFYIYIFFALAIIGQVLIAWFSTSQKLLNLIPIIYVVTLLGVTINQGVLFNNIFMVIVVAIFGYAIFRRIGTVVAESRKKKIKKELEIMKNKDI